MMKPVVYRIVGTLAALAITGVSFVTTAYAGQGGFTLPPTPMSVHMMK